MQENSEEFAAVACKSVMVIDFDRGALSRLHQNRAIKTLPVSPTLLDIGRPAPQLVG